MTRLLAAAMFAICMAAQLGEAKTLRWSSQGDYLTAPFDKPAGYFFSIW